MNQPTYTEAFKELKEITSEIEQGQISVDILFEKVKRATYLINICKEKLSSTEENIQKIWKDMDEEKKTNP